jgi:hypothetical protein
MFFNERRELNIPAFSVNVQGKSRSISVLQKNLVTIIQNISEKKKFSPFIEKRILLFSLHSSDRRQGKINLKAF